MKRVLRFLIRLYPAWWQRRYGHELEALIGDSGSKWCDVWDLLRGAIQMQMSKWSLGRIVTVCGVAGLVMAGIAAFWMPSRYQSTAILKIPAGDHSQEVVIESAIAALSRSSLANIINDQDLYRRERSTTPMENVVQEMRNSIRITPIMSNAQTVAAMTVQFTYQDPSTAQKITQTLARRFTGFDVLDQPTFPQTDMTDRWGIVFVGLGIGLVFGVLLALILRRRTPATS